MLRPISYYTLAPTVQILGEINRFSNTYRRYGGIGVCSGIIQTLDNLGEGNYT